MLLIFFLKPFEKKILEKSENLVAVGVSRFLIQCRSIFSSLLLNYLERTNIRKDYLRNLSEKQIN